MRIQNIFLSHVVILQSKENLLSIMSEQLDNRDVQTRFAVTCFAGAVHFYLKLCNRAVKRNIAGCLYLLFFEGKM